MICRRRTYAQTPSSIVTSSSCFRVLGSSVPNYPFVGSDIPKYYQIVPNWTFQRISIFKTRLATIH